VTYHYTTAMSQYTWILLTGAHSWQEEEVILFQHPDFLWDPPRLLPNTGVTTHLHLGMRHKCLGLYLPIPHIASWCGDQYSAGRALSLHLDSICICCTTNFTVFLSHSLSSEFKQNISTAHLFPLVEADLYGDIATP
jgi:hypothetical protein